MSETSPKCNRCGAPLPPDAPEGLCPRCLVALNLATQTDVPGETGPHGTAVNKPPPTPPLPPAEIAKLFPQLEILECLGRGGMGAVYKARQPSLDRFVALKILAPRSGGDLDFAERFTREARALARLSHPNIVAVYDFGQIQRSAGVPPAPDAAGETPALPLSYFIMEYVDGPNLRQVEQAGKLSPREALEIIPQICAALQFAHDEGIVHRDIKPENVLLDKKGRVKIADFGLAKILGQEPKDFRLTGVRDVVGTPHYMAPEQVEKPQEVDHRADIYSLGVVFYEMLTGELPLGKFQPPSFRTRGVQIDVRLDEVVMRSLEKEPHRRYQHVSEVKTQVETIATTTAPGSSRREEAPSSKSEIRNPKSEIKPRFSRTATTGVCWAAFPPLIWFLFHPIEVGSITIGLKLTAILLLALTFTAPFGTTILGWIAMSQIRHSAGRLYGLGLAVFDCLLFPLLALDSLIVGGFLLVMRVLGQISLAHAEPGEIVPPVWVNYWWLGLAALLASVLIDFLIIRRVWHAVKKPAATSVAPPGQKPDRFWQRFAVVMACVVLIPIAIAILGLLAAIAIPNFVRARQHSQQLAVQQWTQEGWQLWQAQKMDQAAAKFQRAVQFAPDDADAWNGLGWATFNSGKSQEAEKAFQKAISLDTNQPGALNGLGQIYLSRRLYNQAETYLLKAAPQAPAAWYGLTRLYLLEGKFDQAESWAQKLVDSGQADDLARQMLKAAQEKHLSEGLRFRIEPPPAAKETGSTPAGLPSTNSVPASAETWSPTLAAGGRPDLQKMLTEAKELMDVGHYEEALQRHLWYHNHALEYDQGQTGVRLSFALADWVELGRRYPKAKQAMIDIRAQKTHELEEGRGYSEMFQEVDALNRELQDTDATYSLFKAIEAKDTKMAQQCYFYAESLLVSKGEYQSCRKYMGDPQWRFNLIQNGWETELDVQKRMARTRELLSTPAIHLSDGSTNKWSPPDTSAMMKKSANDRFVNQTRQLIEILVATGSKADAEKIRDQAVALLDDARLKSAVDDAEKKIGKQGQVTALPNKSTSPGTQNSPGSGR